MSQRVFCGSLSQVPPDLSVRLLLGSVRLLVHSLATLAQRNCMPLDLRTDLSKIQTKQSPSKEEVKPLLLKGRTTEVGEGYCVKLDTTTSKSHRGEFEGEHHLTSSYIILHCLTMCYHRFSWPTVPTGCAMPSLPASEAAAPGKAGTCTAWHILVQAWYKMVQVSTEVCKWETPHTHTLLQRTLTSSTSFVLYSAFLFSTQDRLELAKPEMHLRRGGRKVEVQVSSVAEGNGRADNIFGSMPHGCAVRYVHGAAILLNEHIHGTSSFQCRMGWIIAKIIHLIVSKYKRESCCPHGETHNEDSTNSTWRVQTVILFFNSGRTMNVP